MSNIEKALENLIEQLKEDKENETESNSSK